MLDTGDGAGDEFKEPLGGGGGAADANGGKAGEPFRKDFRGAANQVGPGVDAAAQVTEDFAVGGVLAGNEHYCVVAGSKGFQLGVAGCYLGADGVVNLDHSTAPAQRFAYFLILQRAFGGLRENLHWLRNVYTAAVQSGLKHGHVLNHYGIAANLAQKAKNLRMTNTAENDDCTMAAIGMKPGICIPDPFLKLKHHRAMSC